MHPEHINPARTRLIHAIANLLSSRFPPTLIMAQYNPRLHNEIYPFIAPSKFKGALAGKVVVITGARTPFLFPAPSVLVPLVLSRLIRFSKRLCRDNRPCHGGMLRRHQRHPRPCLQPHETAVFDAATALPGTGGGGSGIREV